MVAIIGRLDRDVLQAGFVEQVARKLGTTARQVRPVVAVLPQDVSHPQLRAEDHGEEKDRADRDQDGHGETSLSATTAVCPSAAVAGSNEGGELAAS
jgi:hypothetical protein